MKNKFMQTGSLIGLVIALLVTASMAQQPSLQIPIYLGIKTGTASGAGSYGSKIKAVLTFVNQDGSVQTKSAWLSDATLVNGEYSRIQTSMFFRRVKWTFDVDFLPRLKKLRLENNGVDSAWTGDNWYCEWVCVQYSDDDTCENKFQFNRWINGGQSAEMDNPFYVEWK
jgi:hypothetical protein